MHRPGLDHEERRMNIAQTVDANELVTEHLHLVQHVVNQLASRYPRHVDRSELWSAGAHGLVDASRRYDPETGIPFGRYATIRIRGAIIDSTRTRDWATRNLRREMRTVQQAGETFEATHGRAPNNAELMALLGMSEQELATHQASAASATLLHLDHGAGGGEAGENGLAARVEEQDSTWLPEESVEQRELTGTIRTAVQFLPDAQREVIERYYFNGELLRDIADSLGVTEARASQIRSEALTAMRAYFGTAFEGVPTVAADAPGLRRRAAYVAAVSAHTSWRSRLDAVDAELGEARVVSVA
jgi:RNA polymerase sigma factor for flagellar operon FliA